MDTAKDLDVRESFSCAWSRGIPFQSMRSDWYSAPCKKPDGSSAGVAVQGPAFPAKAINITLH